MAEGVSTLDARLRAHAATGLELVINYASGSRVGTPRAVVVIAVHDDHFFVREGDARGRTKYFTAKVIWVESDDQPRVVGPHPEVAPAVVVVKPSASLKAFRDLAGYAAHLRQQLEGAGWHVVSDGSTLGICRKFKNGAPMKTPSVQLWLVDRSTETLWNDEAGDMVEVARVPTGRERPWRLDSWRFTAGKTFSDLHNAVVVFLDEVEQSHPSTAKGMWAAHGSK